MSMGMLSASLNIAPSTFAIDLLNKDQKQSNIGEVIKANLGQICTDLSYVESLQWNVLGKTVEELKYQKNYLSHFD